MQSVLRIRDVYLFIPDPTFFPSRIQGQKDSGSRIRICIIEVKNFFPKKIVSELSEICSGMFIPDLDRDFLPIPDPWVKKASDPGADPDPPHPLPRDQIRENKIYTAKMGEKIPASR
jgi:hypothetical protein